MLNNYTISGEGGYSNRVNDRGGETNMGISKKMYKNENIKGMTRERVNALLYRDFAKYNNIDTLPDWLAGPVIDASIVTGGLDAISALHKALGIIPTGDIIGKETHKRLNEFEPQSVMQNFVKYLIEEANDIVKEDLSQIENLQGWKNRYNRFLTVPFYQE